MVANGSLVPSGCTQVNVSAYVIEEVCCVVDEVHVGLGGDGRKSDELVEMRERVLGQVVHGFTT